jgi:hypothetical protein
VHARGYKWSCRSLLLCLLRLLLILQDSSLRLLEFAEWMLEGSQGWRIGVVDAVELAPVDEAAAVGNKFVTAGLVWGPADVAVSSPTWV